MDNTLYKKKYYKYKSKYLTLKNQFAGTREESNNYLLHGTNLFYIDDIKKNGLSGLYNQEIYDIIKKHWPTILDSAEYSKNYIDWFIERQENIRSTTGQVQLSFTGQSSVAEEYSSGARKFGEGPSRFLKALQKYCYDNKDIISEDMIRDKNFLEEAKKYPGMILAIDTNDFEDTKYLSLDMWEHVLSFPIPADKLYIRKDKNDYIKLLSEEGISYIDKLKYEFLEKEKLIKEEKEEKERTKLLEGWETETMDGPNKFSYEIHKKNNTMTFEAGYDIFDELRYPHSLQLKISNYSDININIAIKNILGTENYEIITYGFKGYDLIISNSELKEKLKTVINGIMSFIPEKRKVKILEKLIEKIPYLAN